MSRCPAALLTIGLWIAAGGMGTGQTTAGGPALASQSASGGDVVRLPPVGEVAADEAAAVDPALAAPPLAPVADGEIDRIEGELKKLAWKKGDFTVTPYAWLTASGVYETTPSAVGEYTVYVLPERDKDEDAWYFDARSTRLGLIVGGPDACLLPDAKLGGRIEFDFQGRLVPPNRQGVLFRRAYIEAKHEDYRLSIGQDWEVISPLYPGMLMYVPGSGGGNLGYRRAMARAERYVALRDDLKMTLEGSLNKDIVSDFVTDPIAPGHTGGWPVLEGRLAFTYDRQVGEDVLPIGWGISAHVGEQEFDFLPPDDRTGHWHAPTWSFNTELRVPITKRLGVASELFTGTNLGAYMGGVLQGVDRLTREPIDASGGWVDVWYDWTPKTHSHVGCSIDDPDDKDLTSGRSYNQFIFGNVTYDVTKEFLLGVEVSQWTTLWVDQNDGDMVRVEVQGRYMF